jgi:hypothetical protein
MSFDVSASIGALIAQNLYLFLAQPSKSPSPIFVDVQSDPLATHIPASCMSRILSLRFPGGGGFDNTTAILCCRVTDPVAVQSLEAECERLNVQWYRMVTHMHRTPAIKLALTNLRFEHVPLADAAASAPPSLSHSALLFSPPPPSLPQSSLLQSSPSALCKASFLCDADMHVSMM